MERTARSHVRVAGVPAALMSEAQLVEAMVADCAEWRAGRLPRPTTVFETNCHVVSLYAEDPRLRDAIEAADIVHADGQFIVYLSRLLGRGRIPERTCTTDVIHAAARAAEANGLSFFLLGGKDEINEACVARLRELYPRLRIAGRHHGYFDADAEDRVIDEINRSGADIVWVGLGKPEENYFCIQNRHRIRCAWLMTCGGCFNYITGDYARAPGWMRATGLEWLHRFSTGPAYLRKRYFETIPHGIWLAAYWAWKDARGQGPRAKPETS